MHRKIRLSIVMPGFMPGIHEVGDAVKTWVAGTSPAMTGCSIQVCVVNGSTRCALRMKATMIAMPQRKNSACMM